MPSCNSLVVGDLDTTSRFDGAIQINQYAPANGGANVCGGQPRLGCPSSPRPSSRPGPSTTLQDFSTYTDAQGFSVIRSRSDDHPGRYLLTNSTLPPAIRSGHRSR